MTFRLGLCAGLLLFLVLPVKGQDLVCRAPLTRLSIIADMPLQPDLLSRLQNRLTGTCADRQLTQSLVPEIARFLASNQLRPAGLTLDHDAGQQRAVISLTFNNATLEGKSAPPEGVGLSRYLLPIEGPAQVLVQLAELVGQPQEGETLQLRFVPAPNVAETSLRMNWLRDGAEIAGATGRRYRLETDDIGARIALRLEADLPNAAPVITEALGPVTPRPVPPQFDNLRLTGRPEVGGKLSLAYDFRAGSNAAPLGRIEYQWLRDNAPIAGADRADYTLQKADIGRAIAVRLRGFDAMGMATLPVETAMQAAIKDVPTLDMVRPMPRPAPRPPEDVPAANHAAFDKVTEKTTAPDLSADIILVRKHVVVGQYGEALRLTDRLLQANPNYSALRLMRSRIFMEQGDYAAAQSGLAELLAAPDLPMPMRETVLAMQSDIHNRALMASARANRTRPREQGRLHLAAEMRVGLDHNARHAPSEARLIYHLDNLAALDDLRPQAVTGPAPGAPGVGEDGDEPYQQTALSAHLAGLGSDRLAARLYLAGMVLDRRYDDYDDNNDAIGDGDYQIILARAGWRSVSPGGGEQSFFDISLTASHFIRLARHFGDAVEVNGQWVWPLARHAPQSRRPDAICFDLSVMKRQFEPIPGLQGNEDKSGWRGRTNMVYTRHGKWLDADFHLGLTHNSHDRNTLDYSLLDGGVRLKRQTGSRAYRLELAYIKRVNVRAPTRRDIEALWGLERRDDNALRLGLGFVQNIPLGRLRGQIVLDAHGQVNESNLPRYDRTGGDVGLSLRVVW